ncbi:hypothetical protein ACJX0J_025713, partial [Zea mays]
MLLLVSRERKRKKILNGLPLYFLCAVPCYMHPEWLEGKTRTEVHPDQAICFSSSPSLDLGVIVIPVSAVSVDKCAVKEEGTRTIQQASKHAGWRWLGQIRIIHTSYLDKTYLSLPLLSIRVSWVSFFFFIFMFFISNLEKKNLTLGTPVHTRT